MSAWPSTGEALAVARRGRRTTKATDLLIIATAAGTGRTLHTRDDRQRNLAREAGVAVLGDDPPTDRAQR